MCGSVMAYSYDPIEQFPALRSAYHPDYGLPDETRLEAVRLVVHWRVSVSETARLCNVSASTVYNWLKAAGQPAPRRKEL
jgi:transposase-like protein